MADDLTPKQKARLEKLRMEIRLTQITVSFSLDEWNDGRKMGAFYSANAVRRLPGVSNPSEWTIDEARLAGCILSKHVVETVYRDAVKRGILTQKTASSEAAGILAGYDANIKRMLQNGDEDES